MKPKSKRKAKPMTKKKTQKPIALVPSKPAVVGPALAAPPAAAPKAEQPGPPTVKLPAPPVNRRITAGAAVTDWRVVRSLRAGKPGYFLQGGHFQKTSRGNSFIVGEEFHFTELKKANEALAQKVPPKPKPAVKSAPPVATAKSENAPAR
jgi:hypothetical protein